MALCDPSGSGKTTLATGLDRPMQGSVTLFDNGHLDAESRGRLLDLLHRLKNELGFTLVVVTHDPLVAERAGRVVNLQAGRVRD